MKVNEKVSEVEFLCESIFCCRLNERNYNFPADGIERTLIFFRGYQSCDIDSLLMIKTTKIGMMQPMKASDGRKIDDYASDEKFIFLRPMKVTRIGILRAMQSQGDHRILDVCERMNMGILQTLISRCEGSMTMIAMGN